MKKFAKKNIEKNEKKISKKTFNPFMPNVAFRQQGSNSHLAKAIHDVFVED